jgi:hypothetical protein
MHYTTSRKVASSILDKVIEIFFNLPNTSLRTMSLGFIPPLRGMSSKNLPGSKKRLARAADNHRAIS